MPSIDMNSVKIDWNLKTTERGINNKTTKWRM